MALSAASKMSDGSIKRLWMLAMSAVIAIILVAQILGSFSHTNRYFPFLWYPMFAQPRHDGDRLVLHHTLFAVMPGGERRPVSPEQLKIDYWRFERLVVPAVTRQDWQRLSVPLRQIRELHPGVRGIEVEDYPLVITANGPASAPRLVVASLDLERGGR